MDIQLAYDHPIVLAAMAVVVIAAGAAIFVLNRQRTGGLHTTELRHANERLQSEIVERQRAELALTSQQEFLRNVIDTIPNCIFVKDWDGNYILANQATAEACGTTIAKLIGKADRDINPNPNEVKQLLDDDTEVMETLQEKIIPEETVTTPTGKVRWFQAIKKPLILSDGKARHVLGVITDITERKQNEQALQQAQAALRESQRKLTTLIDSLPGIVFTCANDAYWSMRYLSEGCLNLTGYNSEELVGENTYNLINHPEDVPRVLGTISAAIAKKQAYVVEYRITTKLGQEKWLWEKGSGVFNSNGEVLGIEGFITDITELKQVEAALQQAHDELEIRVQERTTELSNTNKQLRLEIAERQRAEAEIKNLNQDLKRQTVELEAANKELEAFSYSVSHDLRAPLRAINGFSRILLQSAPQPTPEAIRYLHMVGDNAQQMGCLIDDLLTFSRLSRSPLKKQPVAPTDLVYQALANLRDQQQNRDVEMLISDLPACQADPALLKQVWVNLLANALKFTHHSQVAHIEVGHQQIDSDSVYFVKDNGVGFDMQYAHKLFGVFQRLHRAEDYEGTGVGLAIVQRIIHRHGGRVWAEAEVNKGATFYFTVGENMCYDTNCGRNPTS